VARKDKRGYYAKEGSQNKINIINHYTNGKMSCQRCGFADCRALSVDHINGGGKQHLKEIGIKFHRWIIKNNYPDGFQILCMNCQFIKRDENQEYWKPDAKRYIKV
jgi:hypothetical protein